MIYILIFLFVIIAVIALFLPNEKLIKLLIFIILGLLLIVIAGFRDEYSDRDHKIYIDMFENKSDAIVEPAFLFISYVLHTVSGNNSIYLFVCFAILGVGLKFIAIKQLTELWFL